MLPREFAKKITLEVLYKRRESVNVFALKQEVKVVAQERHVDEPDAL